MELASGTRRYGYVPYPACVLDVALQTVCEALQLALCGLSAGASDHGLPAQDDSLPPCHGGFTLPQQLLLLLHQLVESHLCDTRTHARARTHTVK